MGRDLKLGIHRSYFVPKNMESNADARCDRAERHKPIWAAFFV